LLGAGFSGESGRFLPVGPPPLLVTFFLSVVNLSPDLRGGRRGVGCGG
jgi:hypothetical protein